MRQQVMLSQAHKRSCTASTCCSAIQGTRCPVHTLAALDPRRIAATAATRSGVTAAAAVIAQQHGISSTYQQQYNSNQPTLLSQPLCTARNNCVLCAAAAAESAAATAPDLDPRVYTDASVVPEPFTGPIAAAVIPGKGRGLVATESLSPGQLLLVTPPLVLVDGDLGDIPDHDELQEMITDSGVRFSKWQVQWLRSLVHTVGDDHDDGSSSSSSSGEGGSSSGSDGSSSSSSDVLVDLPEFLPPEGQQGSWWEACNAAADAAAAAAAAGSSDDGVLFADLEMSDEQLWGAIVLNCYGEGFQDLPATLCCDGPLNSQLGLWGPFALLNHSCSPNAVNFTLRDRMIVRATSHIPAGDEITINYLGRGALRPLSQREEELEACYGFRCDCIRCQTESQLSDLPTAAGSTLGLLLDQIQEKIGTVYEPLLQQAVNNINTDDADNADVVHSDEKLSTEVQNELVQLAAEMQEDLDDLLSPFSSSSSSSDSSSSSSSSSTKCASIMHSLSTPAAAAAWTQASAFDLLGLLQEALAAAKQSDDEILRNLVQVCYITCPGSDLHVFQALRRLSKIQQRLGVECEESQQAMDALVTALGVRYGQQVVRDEVLLQRMIAATSKAADMVSF